MYPYIIQQNQVTVVVEGTPHVVDKTAANYDALINAIKANDEVAVKNSVTPAEVIANFDQQSVSIKDGKVYWNDVELNQTITRRMISMIKEGFDASPLASFIDNLMKNPSNRAVNELYGFLEANSIPITSDGCFLAYKRVRDDYTDVHSGTISNKPGTVVSMPRNQVDDNPNNTCSSGLHFCSLDYLSYFGGARIVTVKINPMDVVSIPVDYNNSKGRTCRYEVVSEMTVRPEHAFSKSVQDDYDMEDEYDEEDLLDDEYDEDDQEGTYKDTLGYWT